MTLRTVLVGFGRVAAGYASDPLTMRHFPFATHAQVLAAHPEFHWDAVVDPADAARSAAREEWGIPTTAGSVAALREDGYRPDVAVLAVPPGARLSVLRDLPAVRAVMVEKPLASSAPEAERFLEECERRGIAVQVNFWRRGDSLMRALAGGELVERIGAAQTAFGVYGRGLANNGSHLIDLVRLLVGEVRSVRALGAHAAEADPDVGFRLECAGGVGVVAEPIAFEHYREVGLVVWGRTGTAEILNEGLSVRTFPVRPHRAMSGATEVDFDDPQEHKAGAGDALYHLYDNLARAVAGEEDLWSPGGSALRTTGVVDAILASTREDGRRIEVEWTS